MYVPSIIIANQTLHNTPKLSSTQTCASTSRDSSSTVDSDWGRCVNATTSLNIVVSADADVPPVYTKDSSMSLWSY